MKNLHFMSLSSPLKSPNNKKRAISRPFAIAIRAARLYTASLSLLCSGRKKKEYSYHTIMPII